MLPPTCTSPQAEVQPVLGGGAICGRSGASTINVDPHAEIRVPGAANAFITLMDGQVGCAFHTLLVPHIPCPNHHMKFNTYFVILYMHAVLTLLDSIKGGGSGYGGFGMIKDTGYQKRACIPEIDSCPALSKMVEQILLGRGLPRRCLFVVPTFMGG